MLRLSTLLKYFFLLPLAMLISCGGGGGTASRNAPKETAKVEVSISGMTCTGCENTIQANLMKVPGVISVKASYTAGNAMVEFDPAVADTLKLREAVNGCGYTTLKVATAAGE